MYKSVDRKSKQKKKKKKSLSVFGAEISHNNVNCKFELKQRQACGFNTTALSSLKFVNKIYSPLPAELRFEPRNTKNKELRLDVC